MKLLLAVRKKQGSFTLDIERSCDVGRTGVFGKSGSGKSTLVHLLAGLVQPDEGEISLDGAVLFSASRKINVPPDKRGVALVFQHAHLFPHLDVKANLLYGYRRCGGSGSAIRPDALIELLRLEPLLERRITHLSGGERQRVALGRAVLSNPRLLLMDEPLSALDDQLRFQIVSWLRQLSAEFHIPYLLVSHSILEMQLMSSNVLLMDQGRVLEETLPEQLARSRMAESAGGYRNLICLEDPEEQQGLFSYRWSGKILFVSDGERYGSAMFELSSRDIILFRKHPEAISARNLLACLVRETFDSGQRLGVVLDIDGAQLVAEVVRPAAEELGIQPGLPLFAAVKASSFRRLGSIRCH